MPTDSACPRAVVVALVVTLASAHPSGASLRPTRLPNPYPGLTLPCTSAGSSGTPCADSEDRSPARGDSLTRRLRTDLVEWRFVDAFDVATSRLAERVASFGPGDPRSLRALLDVAEVAYAMGAHIEAERLWRRLYRVARDDEDDGALLPNAALGLARTLRRPVGSHRSLEGRALLDALLDSCGSLSPSLRAAALELRANYDRRTEEGALETYLRAVRAFEQAVGRSHPQTIDAMTWAAWEAIRAGEPATATALIDSAWNRAQRLPAALGILRPLLEARGILARARGDRVAALEADEAALRMWRRLRFEYPSDYGRVRYAPTIAGQLVAMHIDAGRLEAAWKLWTGTRADVWRTIRAPANRDDADRDALLRRELDWRLRESRSSSVGVHPAITTRDVEGLRAWARRLAADRAVVRAAMRTEGDVPSPEQIAEALEPDEALVLYVYVRGTSAGPCFPSRPRLFALVLRRAQSLRAFELPIGSGAASNPIPRVARAITRAARWPLRVALDDDTRGACRDLWDRCVAPLLPALAGVRHVITDMEPLRWGVPLACAIDPDGRPLIDRFGVTYCPAPAAMLRSRGNAPRVPRTLVAAGAPSVSDTTGMFENSARPPADVGNAPHVIVSRELSAEVAEGRARVEDLPGLPAALGELAAVARNVDSVTVLAGPRARETTFRATLRRSTPDAVHIAAHAVSTPLDAGRAALVLRCEPRSEASFDGDGRLCAAEVAAFWPRGISVTTLSACRTAGLPSPSDGRLGIPQALLARNVETVVAGLWNLDDLTAACVMRRFYENLTGAFKGERRGYRARPMPRDDALADAMLHARALVDATGRHPFAHPAYWAAFVLIGDGRGPATEPSTPAADPSCR